MTPQASEICQKIHDWELPHFPAPDAWFARNWASVTFEWRLSNDLILYRFNARGLIEAYRQWLCLCAVQGRRMQASDMVACAENLHREAKEDWAALVAALPAGALAGEARRRAPENDADYQETLDQLAALLPGANLNARFWPAGWQYHVERRLGWLFAASAAVLAAGGVPLLAIETGPGWSIALGVLAVAGGGGLLGGLLAQQWQVPFRNDDHG